MADREIENCKKQLQQFKDDNKSLTEKVSKLSDGNKVYDLENEVRVNEAWAKELWIQIRQEEVK